MGDLTKGLQEMQNTMSGQINEMMKVTEQTKTDLMDADKPSMSSTPKGPISFEGPKQGELKAFTKNLQVQMSPELQKQISDKIDKKQEVEFNQKKVKKTINFINNAL